MTRCSVKGFSHGKKTTGNYYQICSSSQLCRVFKFLFLPFGFAAISVWFSLIALINPQQKQRYFTVNIYYSCSDTDASFGKCLRYHRKRWYRYQQVLQCGTNPIPCDLLFAKWYPAASHLA